MDAVLSDGTLDWDTGALLSAGSYYYKISGFGSGDESNVYGSTGTNQRKQPDPCYYDLTFLDPESWDEWPEP